MCAWRAGLCLICSQERSCGSPQSLEITDALTQGPGWIRAQRPCFQDKAERRCPWLPGLFGVQSGSGRPQQRVWQTHVS
jgi:hypothetical protein